MCYPSSIAAPGTKEKETRRQPRGERWGNLVTKALKHHSLWLVLTYVGLMLLLARAYA